MKHVQIYTDGACSGNPGPGGWGAILVYKGVEKVMSGFDASTTNNRMELTSAIRAFSVLKEPCRVDFYSDSKYVVDANLKGWLESWVRHGWKKSDKSAVQNRDLWEEFLAVTDGHAITFHWVRGHDGHEMNERCDRLAVAEIEKRRE